MRKSQIFANGFLIFVLIAFLNAFIDLGHKIVLQNTVFKTFDGEMQIMLSALINALILLPFILMMTPASYLSDTFSKAKVMERSALAAIALTALITVSYYAGWFWVAFALTLALAMQSAIYSPAKYGAIKILVGNSQLAKGNGIVQAVTTSAILLGTLAFSFGFESMLAGHSYSTPHEVLPLIAPLGFILVALSVVEWLLAKKLMRDFPKEAHLQNQKPFDVKEYASGRSGYAILLKMTENKVIFKSVIGLAVFWSVCQVVLAAFPAFAKESSSITNTFIIQGVMTFAGIGIILGAAFAGRFSKNYIETGLIPVGAAGVALAMAFLGASNNATAYALTFLALGFFGGLYLVPLNALIQYHAKPTEMGKILAGSNFIQNMAMLSFLILTIIAALIGTNSAGIISALFIVAVLGAIYTVKSLPQSLARFVVSIVFSFRYKLTVIGMDKIPARGGVLMLGNHISWVDWAIIQMASPRPVRFVMAKQIYDRWYLKPIFNALSIIPVGGSASKTALDSVKVALNAGEVVCLFPEGSISRNGQLGTFQRGFEVAAKDAEAVIVPFYLRGLWGSRFSRASDRLKASRSKYKSDLITAFGKPLDINSDRFIVKQAVTQLSLDAWSHYTQSLPKLADAVFDGVKRQGSEMAAADIIGTNMSGYRLLTAMIAFSSKIYAWHGQNIGILMPSTTAGIIANGAALFKGKTLVNLNFTASHESLVKSIERANIKTVMTSRKFVDKLAGRGFDVSILDKFDNVIYLEDVKENLSKAQFIATMLAVRLLPSFILKKLVIKAKPADVPAVILFSSGSEGTPKGVMLSDMNIMSNVKQVTDVLNTDNEDVVMAVLPLFHAFGLTVTTFLPLVESLPVVCHPDPTDAKNIAKGIATYRGTILCGTSTFLRMYCRDKKVHPLMLESLRIVVAGAEKLDSKVRDDFMIKFNKPVYEGYGATETTPVASVNIPDKMNLDTFEIQKGNKVGTVGLPLPGTHFKIVDPVGLEPLPQGEAGLILIGGNQVMLGYLLDEKKTSEAISLLDEVRFYHTGDKGYLDEDGFLVIVDRYSRFAKIGGEMISLGNVEQILSSQLPEGAEVMVVNLPCPKKGERLVLLYVGIDEAAVKAICSGNLDPLMRPSAYKAVEALPKLGSGKADFSRAKQIAS